MKLTRVNLDSIELTVRTTKLGQQTLCSSKGWELYYTSEQALFIVAKHSNYFNGRTILIPFSNVKQAVVSPADVPKNQPVGTAKNRDTADGRRKQGSVAKAKSVLAERIEARASDKAASETSDS